MIMVDQNQRGEDNPKILLVGIAIKAITTIVTIESQRRRSTVWNNNTWSNQQIKACYKVIIFQSRFLIAAIYSSANNKLTSHSQNIIT